MLLVDTMNKAGNYWDVRLHPWRFTWNIIMEVRKIIFLSKWVICRFHVNLPGCKWRVRETILTEACPTWLFDVKQNRFVIYISEQHQAPCTLSAKVFKRICINMGVSKNRGTPKSSILIGFSLLNHPFWGTPIFGNTHILFDLNFETRYRRITHITSVHDWSHHMKGDIRLGFWGRNLLVNPWLGGSARCQDFICIMGGNSS